MVYKNLTHSVGVCHRTGGWSRFAARIVPVMLAVVLAAASAGAQTIYESNGELGDWNVAAGALTINTNAMTLTASRSSASPT